MKTDVNKLHRILLNSHPQPREGKTFAEIHKLASFVLQNRYEKIIVFLPRLNYKNHIFPLLEDIFKEQGIEYSRTHTKVITKNCLITFHSKNEKNILIGQPENCLALSIS